MVIALLILALHQETTLANRSQDLEKAVVEVLAVDTSSINSQGSGFIINNYGYVLTNYHVVRNSTALNVIHNYTKRKFKQHEVKMIAADHIRDIALIKLDGYVSDENMKPLTLDRSQLVREKDITLDCSQVSRDCAALKGQGIAIMGSHKESKNYYIESTVGGFSTTFDLDLRGKNQNLLPSRYNYPVFVLNNDITRGHSGSPVVDTASKVIGIAAGVGRRSKYNAFVIPIAYALELLNAVKTCVPTDYECSKLYALCDLANCTPGIHPKLFSWKNVDENDDYYGSHLYSTIDIKMRVAKGLVFSSKKPEPVKNAIVQLTDPGTEFAATSRTDENGMYKFPIIDNGNTTWSLEVTQHGYIKYTNKNFSMDHQGDFPLTKLQQIPNDHHFYATPSILSLKDKGTELVNIYSESSLEQNANIDWTLCNRDKKCGDELGGAIGWIKLLSDGSGITSNTGAALRITKETMSPPVADGYSTELIFVNNSKWNKHSKRWVVPVYSGQLPQNHQCIIIGVLKDQTKLWPDNIQARVSAYSQHQDISNSQRINHPKSGYVDSDGLFILKFDSRIQPCDEVAKLKLKLDTPGFRIKQRNSGIYEYNFGAYEEPLILVVEEVN